MRIVRLGAITTLGVLAVTVAVAAGPRSRDVNRAHRGSAPQVAVEADVSDEADDPSIQALAKTIAIVSLPAPSTDVAIDITVTNTSSAREDGWMMGIN